MMLHPHHSLGVHARCCTVPPSHVGSDSCTSTLSAVQNRPPLPRTPPRLRLASAPRVLSNLNLKGVSWSAPGNDASHTANRHITRQGEGDLENSISLSESLCAVARPWTGTNGDGSFFQLRPKRKLKDEAQRQSVTASWSSLLTGVLYVHKAGRDRSDIYHFSRPQVRASDVPNPFPARGRGNALPLLSSPTIDTGALPAAGIASKQATDDGGLGLRFSVEVPQRTGLDPASSSPDKRFPP